MFNVVFGTVSKRKNSTYQPTCTATFNVTLKDATSLDRPTFLISAETFNYNYCQWDSNYYFVDNVTSPRQGQWEVTCILDPLATYKDYILASTQFVAYSSLSGGAWLPDTRIPVLKSTDVSVSSASMGGILNDTGIYVLTANGQEGCRSYLCNKSHLTAMLHEITNWADSIIQDIQSQVYDWSSIPNAISSLGLMAIQSDVFGNAYQEAPYQIKSCIWVPFAITPFLDGAPSAFYLGAFNCNLSPLPYYAKTSPVTGSVSVSIPWHYSDWRRAICEDVYLYLPLVGNITLSGDSLTHTSNITVNYSATITDGVICYEIVAGGEIIGTYGGQCSANYPIGVSQQASAGEIMQSFINSADKVLTSAVHSTPSPVSMGVLPFAAGFESFSAAYDVTNTVFSRHNSTIGGVGGGAGVGLDLDVKCYTVSHPTVISPSDMKDTMGVPTMQPVTLSSLSGYCQCVNAHVSAPAEAHILDAIDLCINNGFYIE